MPSALIRILRDQKTAIAEQLVALVAETPILEAERQAMALAQVDSLIGMTQQQPEILAQMLDELTRTQLDDPSEFGPAMAAIQDEHQAALAAVVAAYPESREALDTMIELERLTAQRTQAVVQQMTQQMQLQIRETAADRQVLRTAVQELSTPIIPLYSGILVLPLVGRIDGVRAQDVTEQLLEAIAREQADIVLLDVTGISSLDTSVANHLMQTARAAALLGSQVILVGISAPFAQTLVELDVELGSLVTLSDLQSGVEYALAQLGLAIKPQ
ncbi:MAG: STAS domain-containing protein [Roseiflexaceae bacterium]|nr:STAS domain-containing protein [Roseiflexaceae bacterium]